MTKLFITPCLAWSQKQKHPRKSCGILAGTLGIGINLLLFVGKLSLGLFTGSVAIMADAWNNLSDCAASAVTILGFSIAEIAPDQEHPFGHGRAEYLSGLAISVAILFMGVELAQLSWGKLFDPQPVFLSFWGFSLMVLAVLTKLWMYFFYKAFGKAVDSSTITATGIDSLSDALSTIIVLVSALLSPYLPFAVDAWAGILVSFFILKNGWETLKDTISPLLGRPMDPELAADIQKLVKANPHILGIHDLVYHDYGPGRAMMSFHAEVPADGDFLQLHDVIDTLENALKCKYHIDTVIHMDPMIFQEELDELRLQLEDVAQQIHPELSIHDVRTTAGPMFTKVVFDVLVPYGLTLSDGEIKKQLGEKVKALSPQYLPLIEIDHSFISDQ